MIAYTAYTDLHLNQINLYTPPKKNQKQKTKNLWSIRNPYTCFIRPYSGVRNLI